MLTCGESRPVLPHFFWRAESLTSTTTVVGWADVLAMANPVRVEPAAPRPKSPKDSAKISNATPSIENSSGVPQVWLPRSEGFGASHKGFSENFLGVRDDFLGGRQREPAGAPAAIRTFWDDLLNRRSEGPGNYANRPGKADVRRRILGHCEKVR
jgi:hypothetical protein